MFRFIKKHKNAVQDFLYSFTAYALPTVVLQFLVYPLIAEMTTGEENGLFLTLLNVVRLCASILALPLAKVRLLRKKECMEDPTREGGFNLLFLIIMPVAAAATIALYVFYCGMAATLWGTIRLLVCLLLIAAHDYFEIGFRVIIDYKKILISNLLIVLGYGIGLVLMYWFGYWELIFICGYAISLAYIMWKTPMWKKKPNAGTVKEILPQYSPLLVSSGIGRATVYCDKMLLYPILGGEAVSIYNAAAIVSKVISLVKVPACNVLLSYIVDKERPNLSRKKLGILFLLMFAASVVAYGVSYLASIVLCRLLYSQYYVRALPYVPLILFAILIETINEVLRTILIRYLNTSLSLVCTTIKAIFYITGVLLLSGVLSFGLWGFCAAILIADAAQMCYVLWQFIRMVSKGSSRRSEEAGALPPKTEV